MAENKSIFEFADKFGYESPFGDWIAEEKQKREERERLEKAKKQIRQQHLNPPEKKGTIFYYQEFAESPQNISYWGKNPIDPAKDVNLIKLGTGDDDSFNTIGIVYYTKDLKRLVEDRKLSSKSADEYIVNTKSLKHYFKFDFKMRDAAVEMVNKIQFYGNIVERGLIEVEITQTKDNKKNVERKIIKLEVALPHEGQATVFTNMIHTESIGIIKALPSEALSIQKIKMLNNEEDTEEQATEVEGVIWEVYRKIVIKSGDFSGAGVKGAVLVANFVSSEPIYYKDIKNSSSIRFETVDNLLEALSTTNSELLNKECFIKINLAEVKPIWKNDEYVIEIVSDFHTHPDNELNKHLNASSTDYNMKRLYQKDALLYVPKHNAIVLYIGAIDKDNLKEGTFLYKYLMENASNAQTDNIPIDNDKYIENPKLEDNGAAFYISYDWFSKVSF